MVRLLTTLALLCAVGLSSGTARAYASAPDYAVPQGHFYTQTNGSPRGDTAGGFTISDASGIPFWTYFQSHGGVDVLGYPVSQRFTWDGYVCQATQRAVLQWNSVTGQVQLVNIFDYLSQTGRDRWLLNTHLAPRAAVTRQEEAATTPMSFLTLAHARFAWLYRDPALFNRYFSTPDYYAVFGLPTSPIQDLGPYLAIRTQRAVLYHWKQAVPWADSRGVSVGLAGDLFKELGMIPAAALRPESSPPPAPAGSPAPASTKGPLVPTSPTPSRSAVAPDQTTASSPPTPRRNVSTRLPVLVGVATWYGSDFQGQTMANGEPYDMYDPGTTAANLYPMGTLLRVTRLTTGQSIIVRVTDRGAFRYPDITDLSYAAFSQLADPGTGVISIRVEPLDDN